MEEPDRGSLEHVCAPNLTKLAADGNAIHGINSNIDGIEHNPNMEMLINWMKMEVIVRLRDLDHKLEHLSAKVDCCRMATEESAALGNKSSTLSLKSTKRSGMSKNRAHAPVRNGTRDGATGTVALTKSPKFSLLSETGPQTGSRLRKHMLRIWTVMHDQDSSLAARCYAATMRYLVWISVIITLTQTVKPPPIPGFTQATLETMFDSIFLLEIAIRFVVCPNRRRFLQSAYNVIDIVAAVPLFLRSSIGFMPIEEDKDGCAYICFILLYIVPIIRILKTLRTFRKFHLLLSAFVLVLEALPVLLFTLVVILMIYSTLIYWVEPRSNVASLPTAMYFTIITMTTVGYGDISPSSNGGHVVVALCTITGVLYMAMPIGIIGSAFTETWQRRDRILLTQRIRENLLQWGHSVEDIPELFEEFDTDGDGELHLRDFRRMMNHLRIGLGDDRIMDLFRLIDRDAGGSIDAGEFMRMLFPETYHALYEVGGDRRPAAPKKWTPKWEIPECLAAASNFVSRLVGLPRGGVQDVSAQPSIMSSVLSEKSTGRTAIPEQNEDPDIAFKADWPPTTDEYFVAPKGSLLRAVISEEPEEDDAAANSELLEEPNNEPKWELSTINKPPPAMLSPRPGEPDTSAEDGLSDASTCYENMQSI